MHILASLSQQRTIPQSQKNSHPELGLLSESFYLGNAYIAYYPAKFEGGTPPLYPQTFYGKMRVSLFRQEVRPVICCISDIHGELDKLEQMLELIRFSGEDHLYILGGVIVRGTLGGDIFWRIIAATNMTMLLGNHKQMCLRTLEPNNEFGARDLWRMNGGFVCLPGADLSPDAPRAE